MLATNSTITTAMTTRAKMLGSFLKVNIHMTISIAIATQKILLQTHMGTDPLEVTVNLSKKEVQVSQ